MNSYNELAIKWDEPEINANTGKWWTRAENLTERTKQLLAAQPMCGFIAEERRQAKISLARTWVAQYGAHRCWWWLREEVVEHPVMVSLTMQLAMNDALDRPRHDDVGKRWDDDDLGDLGWGRLDYIS